MEDSMRVPVLGDRPLEVSILDCAAFLQRHGVVCLRALVSTVDFAQLVDRIGAKVFDEDGDRWIYIAGSWGGIRVSPSLDVGFGYRLVPHRESP